MPPDDGGPMPQTREHLAILNLLSVTSGVVALTKIDRVSAARVEEVTALIGQGGMGEVYRARDTKLNPPGGAEDPT